MLANTKSKLTDSCFLLLCSSSSRSWCQSKRGDFCDWYKSCAIQTWCYLLPCGGRTMDHFSSRSAGQFCFRKVFQQASVKLTADQTWWECVDGTTWIICEWHLKENRVFMHDTWKVFGLYVTCEKKWSDCAWQVQVMYASSGDKIGAEYWLMKGRRDILGDTWCEEKAWNWRKDLKDVHVMIRWANE